MTTPNPSRSVSPEPTKGEADAREALAGGLMDAWGVEDSRKWDEPMHPRILKEIMEFETAIKSAYIPLVEAAEALYDQTGCDCDASLDEVAWIAPTHASDCPVYVRWIAHEPAFLAALVQVPGQHQADTGGG